MKHTECKDCELSNGDCGYHFKMDGTINYDIASLSACDRYGNCEFFKPKAKPKGDLISREALKKYARVVFDKDLGRLRVVDVSDIDNAPTVELFCSYLSDGEVRQPCVEAPCEHERPQGEIKKYKPLEHDYNVQCAVENLKTAYWSNEPEKVAKNFTEAEDIIISAICHHGYTVCKQPQGEWIPCSERLPDVMKKVLVWYEYYRYGDFNCMYQTYGFCYVCDGKWSPFINGETGWTDARIIAWQPLPEPYDSEVHDD